MSYNQQAFLSDADMAGSGIGLPSISGLIVRMWVGSGGLRRKSDSVYQAQPILPVGLRHHRWAIIIRYRLIHPRWQRDDMGQISSLLPGRQRDRLHDLARVSPCNFAERRSPFNWGTAVAVALTSLASPISFTPRTSTATG